MAEELWGEYFDTSWGTVGLVHSRKGLKNLFMPDREEAITGRFERLGIPASPAADGFWVRWVRDYLEGARPGEIGRLDLGDLTVFRRRVLVMLLEIPYGHVRSYGWLAARAGSPRAARAVGGALSENPVPLVLPCHRVIRGDGTLGGFGGGEDLKVKLLQLEGVDQLPKTR